MKRSKALIAVASASASLLPAIAYASVLLPTVELRGAGATTVADVEVRSLNCTGNPGNHVAGDLVNNRFNKYGTNSGQLLDVAPGNYAPTTPTAANPAFNCETQEIQPDFEGKYLGVGSGGGRDFWANFLVTGTNPHGAWTNVAYALSEAPATAANFTAYNANANNAINKAGPAIQFPKFVIPVALAYNPEYGQKTTGLGTVSLTFNVKVPQSVYGVVAGGLRLNKSAYCKIFNGEITNWNDPALKTLNSNTALKNANDDQTRWDNEGVPIRLIGRADRSGGTDVTTRALAAQCTGLVAINKFERAAESLPYHLANATGIDIRRLRADSRYFPTAATSSFANSTQAATHMSIGGLVFDRVSDQVCLWNEVNSATRLCDVSLAPGGVFTTAPTPGLFTVADGTSGVAEAIETTVNNTLLTSTLDPNVKLNGKFGYAGADFVKPVAGRNLHAAALQKGTSTAYVMPSATNAAAAFGSVLPPQTTATSGAFSTTDVRQLGSVNPLLLIDAVTNPATPVSRANPEHWAGVLYNPNVPVTSTLAAPVNGYPITGVAFQLQYSCYKPANAAVPGNNAKRFGIVNQVGLTFGKVTKNSTNTAVAANTYKGTGATAVGILAQSNTAVPSAAWVNAIWETFFKKSTQSSGGTVLGNLNLWVQDNVPTTATDVDGIVQASDQKSNPICDANAGA